VTSAAAVIYVDSNSTDDSVRAARALGADVIELDLSIPFTAARARNAGFARLLTIIPDLAYVQFLDGDCELALRSVPILINLPISHECRLPELANSSKMSSWPIQHGATAQWIT
jgi:glycosyltransferase involved in cell wall biosynthesis